jgi:hypothetical protein
MMKDSANFRNRFPTAVQQRIVISVQSEMARMFSKTFEVPSLFSVHLPRQGQDPDQCAGSW